MKKVFLKLMLLGAVSVAGYVSASAQVYVNVRPVAPVVVQTPRPSEGHVWVGEEWREDGRGYKYAGGHWEAPPHPGARYIPGHWAHDRRGEVWIRGHWG